MQCGRKLKITTIAFDPLEDIGFFFILYVIYREDVQM